MTVKVNQVKKKRTPWNKGLFGVYRASKETRAKMSATQKRLRTAHWTKFPKGKDHPNWKGGKPICPDCGKRTSNYDKIRCAQCNSRYRSGPNCHLYIDGRSKDPMYNRICLHKRRSYKIAPLTIDIVQSIYETNIKKYRTLTCYLCYKKIRFGEDCIEHKTPLSRGGTNKKSNLAISCRSCNCSKGKKTEREYRNL